MNISGLNILFHRLGPYHHARLKALATRCKFSAIEFSTVDDTYKWASVTSFNSFKTISLFTDADIDSKTSAEVIRKIRSTLMTSAPQVVAIPGWSSRASLAALAWCCESHTPAILMSDSTFHGKTRICWKEWVKSRVVDLFSSALVAGKPQTDYVTALGMSGSRVFAGYDVIDNIYFHTRSEEVRGDADGLRDKYGLPTRHFLVSGRFIEEKNLPNLLLAYSKYVPRARDGAWSLVLLGDGPLKEILTNKVACLGLKERVHFIGFRQYDELPVFYGLAGSLILASISETWGLVVNEAMASGLPVLVSNRCGCASDLVQSGVNGFTFDPYNIEELTERMVQISSGQYDLAAMGRASRDIIRNWSPEVFAENLCRAAKVALSVPLPKVSWFDNALLWLLMRR